MPISTSFTTGAAHVDSNPLGSMRKTVNFNTAGVDTNGLVWVGTLPANAIIISCVVKIVTAFNATVTNVLTVGDATTPNSVIGAADINEGAIATTSVTTAVGFRASTTVDTPLFAKYTQTGTAATAGQAVIMIMFVAESPAFPQKDNHMAVFTGIQGFGIPTSTQSAAVLTNGTTVFTVTGGPIHLLQLASYCVTLNDATAATLQWSADGTEAGQAATTITGASASLTAFAAGGAVFCSFVALSTAPVLATTGVGLGSAGGGIIVPPGIITTVIGSGPTTGTWQHYLRWMPLGDSCVVTPSF